MAAPDSKPGRRTRRFDSPEQEAFLNLWRTYDRLSAIEDQWLDRHALSPQQYNTLRLLRGRHPERVQTLWIAGRLVSRAPDISRLIDKLEARGLVDRQRPADNRRVVLIGITPPGLELLEQLDRECADCHARQLGHMPAERLRALISLLQDARAPFEDAGSPWAPGKAHPEHREHSDKSGDDV